MASETNATSTAEPTGIMDSSTHSTSSQPPNNAAMTNNAAAAAAPTNANAATGPTSSTSGGGSSPKRGPPPQQQQAQLLKLREANTKYKNLLKLAKERIQEQEGLLDERRCESNSVYLCPKLVFDWETSFIYLLERPSWLQHRLYLLSLLLTKIILFSAKLFWFQSSAFSFSCN